MTSFEQYHVLECEYFMSAVQIPSLDVSEQDDELFDQISTFTEQMNQCGDLVCELLQQAYQRCIEFVHVAGFPQLIEATNSALEQHAMLLVSALDTVQIKSEHNLPD